MNYYTYADFLPELFTYAFLHFNDETLSAETICVPAENILDINLSIVYQDLATLLMFSQRNQKEFLSECSISFLNIDEALANLFRVTFESAIDDRKYAPKLLLNKQDIDQMKQGISLSSPYRFSTRITSLIFLLKFIKLNSIDINSSEDIVFRKILPLIYQFGGYKKLFIAAYNLLSLDDEFIKELQSSLGLESLSINQFLLKISTFIYHISHWYASNHQPIADLTSIRDLSLLNPVEGIYFKAL